MKLIFLLTLLFLGINAVPQEKPNSYWKKVNKNLEQVFGSSDISRENIEFTADELVYNENIFNVYKIYRLSKGSDLSGYLVLASTKGRFDFFDHMIIYNPDVTVKKISILNYISPHGGEVASPRWLKQFEGYDGKHIIYGKEIDAISGATFSAGNLTKDVEAITNYLKKKVM